MALTRLHGVGEWRGESGPEGPEPAGLRTSAGGAPRGVRGVSAGAATAVTTATESGAGAAEGAVVALAAAICAAGPPPPPPPPPTFPLATSPPFSVGLRSRMVHVGRHIDVGRRGLPRLRLYWYSRKRRQRRSIVPNSEPRTAPAIWPLVTCDVVAVPATTGSLSAGARVMDEPSGDEVGVRLMIMVSSRKCAGGFGCRS
jgi:hypothetical protein